MKAIIYCKEQGMEWVRSFFPGYSPYMLPVGNKPLLEFIIDFCILAGIHDIRLIFNVDEPECVGYFEEGTRYGVRISYSHVSDGTAFRDIIAQNKTFCGENDIFYFQGFRFVEYDKNEPFKLAVGEDEVFGCLDRETGGYVVLGKNRLGSIPPENRDISRGGIEIRESRISGLKDYFDWNMRMVYELRSNYNLPGYSDSQAFIVGRNVQIPKDAEIATPVIFGNLVQLGNRARIGPGVIIGDHSLVDSDVVIHDAIVFDNSYVGCNLEIINKICYRNYLIDPINEIKIDIIDELLMTETVKNGIWKCPITQRVIAFLMLLIYAVPFAILRPFLKIKAVELDCFMDQQHRRKLKLRLYITPPEGWACRYFLKLSLDRYHLLPLVLNKTLRLVGSYILEATEENAELLKQFPDYAPGIFCYSEYLEHGHNPDQRAIDEQYYMYHASFWSNFKILKGILMHNLLKQDIDKQPLRY